MLTTKLKSAEEWCKEYGKDRDNYPRKLTHSTGDYVRAIQINALEAAVELVLQEGLGYSNPNIIRAIESAKDALLTQIEELKK